MADALTMYVVFDRPIDHPNDIVARRWTVRGAFAEVGPIVARARTLPEVRGQLLAIRGDLHCIPPCIDDDPKITEVWL